MSCRILHRRFHQHARQPLLERQSGEIIGQLEIETVHAVGIGLALRRAGIHHADIHGRRLHLDLAAIHRLAEKVIGAHRAGDAVARPVAVLLLAGELHRHLEFGQHVALDVDRDFGLAAAFIAAIEQRAQVVGPQVDLIGQPEVRRCHAISAGLCDLLEDFVAARILGFQRDLARRGGRVIGAVQRERAHVDGLPGLVDGLFGGEQDLRFRLQFHGLGRSRWSRWAFPPRSAASSGRPVQPGSGTAPRRCRAGSSGRRTAGAGGLRPPVRCARWSRPESRRFSNR